MKSTGRRWAFVAILSAQITAFPTLLFAATTAPSTQPDGQVEAEYKIEHWGEPVLIPATVGGKAGFFMLDTGCSYNVVNNADFPRLDPIGDPVVGDTPGGSASFQKYVPPKVRVGPVSLDKCGPVVGMDLSYFLALTGRPIMGLLGPNGLENFIIQLDFDGQKLRFLRQDTAIHREWGTISDMRFDGGGIPRVEFMVDGLKQKFELDTGFVGCLALPAAAFDRLRDVKGVSTVLESNATAVGDATSREMRVPSVDIAGVQYRDLICTETTDSVARLGVKFLERHLVTFDFAGNRLYLKSGSTVDRRVEDDMAGIIATRIGRQTFAGTVDTTGPAYAAGIRADDVLIDLNGKPAGDYEMAEIRELMSAGDGKELDVTFSHAGERKTVKFKLRSTI